MEHVFKLFEFNVYNDKGLDKDSDEDEAYKENKDKPLYCANEVKEFTSCVDKFRSESLDKLAR